MIPVGTKVAVMPNNECDIQLIGRVGIIQTYFEGDTAGVLIDGMRNYRDACGLFWFKENYLSVIPEFKNKTNDSKKSYFDYIQMDITVFIKKVIFNDPKTIIIWKDGTNKRWSAG